MSTVPTSHSIYYRDRYWNDHRLTLQYLIRKLHRGFAHDPCWWMQYFWESYLNQRPVERALFLNCGNGWVERTLYDLGVFEAGWAFDYSGDLVRQAKARLDGRPIDYFVADCASVDFRKNSFDLVVNVAAMHHVQYIDRFSRIIARALRPAGYFVNFDYIGPHRNQYGKNHFELLREINSRLPEGFRAEPFQHPDLDTMLTNDPTEAIHSELILEVFERYFYTLERKDLNGAIAYPIMHNNRELFWQECEFADRCVDFLLAIDQLWCDVGSLPSFFSFFVGKPKKKMFAYEHKALLAKYEREELEREALAEENGGRYLYLSIELPE